MRSRSAARSRWWIRTTASSLATMTVSEKYRIDKAHECKSVFRTTDPAHPGVKMVMQQGEVNLAGPVKVLSRRRIPGEVRRALHDAGARRALSSSALGWSRVAAFQTRNPMHRSHEYLAKIAIEVCDGVLVHSLLGNLKPGDIPAEVRTRAIAVLIEKYFRARHGRAGGLSARHALRGPARGAAARAVPPELRLLAPDRRARPRRRRQATTGPSTRIASSTRSRADALEIAAAEDRLDVLVLSLRRHGLGTHLPARPRGPAAGVGHAIAQVARRRQPKCRRNSRGRKCSRSCARTTPGRPDGLVGLADRAFCDHFRHGHRRRARRRRRRRAVRADRRRVFPFHLDFVRAAGLLLALTAALSAAPRC